MAGSYNDNIMFYIYFARSLKNNKVYVGYTEKHPDERVLDHNHGSNKWSKINKPFILIYFEEYHCKIDALSREKFYKSGFGKNIKKLIIESLSLRP
ncbi:MAG: GIY-YIG nuclease family protein [Candidatus Berkelbacteria bacterium]